MSRTGNIFELFSRGRRKTQRNCTYPAFLLASLLSSTALIAPVWAAEPVSTSAPIQQLAFVDSSVQEVVVTARHRKEKAQDVPIPIAVLSGDKLTEQGTHRLEDIQLQLPSVNVSFLNPRQNSIAVRGLGNNPASDGLESSTGIYLDGVYLGRPGMAIFDLDDLDQFELLRGPQGTLFGKNTTAAALNITTKEPSFTFGGSGEAVIGNYLDHEFRGTITGPIIEDKVAGRIAAYDTERDGILANVANGGRNNGIGRQGVRAQFLFKPSDDLTIRVIGEYNRERDPNGSGGYYNAPPNATFLPFLANLARHGFPSLFNKDRYSYTSTSNDLQTISVQQGGLTTQADYEFGGGYRLTSITAYRFWNFSPHNDADSTSLSLLEAGVQNHDKQFSQELRISSPVEGPIDYTAGLYYFWQGQRTHQYGEYTTNAGPVALAFAPQFVGKDPTVDARLRTRSYAAFGQANWHATDDLTFTLGARNTLEQKTMAIYRNNDGTVLNPLVPNIDSTGVSPKSNNVSSTAAVAYKLTPDISIYASYAHGAKAGATNNSPPPSIPLKLAPLIVQPEKADDGEIGFKSQLFDRQLQLNGNLYYELIRNYQATSFFIDPSNPALAGSVLTNVGAVRTEGAEMEATIRPAEGLSLNTTGSYNNATYRSFRAGPCASEYGRPASATCDLTGRSVVGSPKWIASIVADYHREIQEDVIGYIIAEYAYRSAFFGVIDDSAYSKVDGYGTANLRVGTKFNDGKIDVSLWARNLTDVRYFQTLSISSNRGAYFGTVGEPLTFGATLRYSF